MLPKFCFGSFMLILQSSLFRPIRASGDMSSGASGGAVSSGTVWSGTVSSAASRGGSGVVAPRSATPRPVAMLGRRRRETFLPPKKNKEEIMEMQKDPRVPRRNKNRRRESI